MAIGGILVNTKGASELGGFDPLPKNKYLALIAATQMRTSQSRALTINVEFVVMDGEFKSRKLFENICIYDPNPESKRVGFGMSILKSLSKLFFNGADEWTDDMVNSLKGKKLVLDVGIEGARTDAATGKSYDPRNRINGYESADTWQHNGGVNTPSGFAQQPHPAAQPAAPLLQPAPQPPQHPYPMQHAAQHAAPAQYAQPAPAYAPQPVATPQAAPSFPMPQQPQYAAPQHFTGAAPAPAAPQPAPGAPSWMSGATA